jgi:hypothetical protein
LFDDFLKKYEILKQRLDGFQDLANNIFYDKRKKKFIITDIHKGEKRTGPQISTNEFEHLTAIIEEKKVALNKKILR